MRIFDSEPVRQEILLAVLSRAKQNVSTAMRTLGVSLTLQNFLTAVAGVSGPNVIRGSLQLPFYWAEYVHDGRGSVHAKPGKFLIFFPNKKDDPRTAGGTNYPRTKALRGQLHSLSHADFKRFSQINRERKKAGQDPIMVVTRVVTKGVTEKPFYTVGMRTLSADVAADVNSILSAAVLKITGPRGHSTARGRL